MNWNNNRHHCFDGAYSQEDADLFQCITDNGYLCRLAMMCSPTQDCGIYVATALISIASIDCRCLERKQLQHILYEAAHFSLEK